MRETLRLTLMSAHRRSLASSMWSRCSAFQSGDCGRRPPNERVVTGCYDPVTADQVPRKVQEFLGKVAG